MIVELFGLPGSGKSYLANQLVDELRKENVDAVNMTELSRNKLICKAKKKIIYASLNVNPGIKEIKDEIKACFQHPDSFSSLFGLYRSTEYCLDSLAVMLFYYHKLSKKNKVYALIYGTLIGAVRHHGYIPWDDDVDIMMPRPDYDRLLVYLKEHIGEYPNLRVFNREECAEYPYMITRISDDRYYIKMENELPFGMGVFIDIYPYDGLGQTKKEALSFGLRGDRLSSLCYQATREHFAIETTTSFIRKVVKYPVYIIAKLFGKDFFQNRLEKLARVKEYDKSAYVGCVIWLSWGEKDIFPREWFDETIMMPFEKYEFRVPKCYDDVLRHEYGDYMQLPPEKDRIGHHFYRVYEKTEKIADN